MIAFAAQHVGKNLTQVVEDYAGLAREGAVVDYAFHMIVADPTEATVREHLPPLIRAGHGSIKVFMTYDRLKVDDEPLLDVLVDCAREPGARLRPCRESRHDLVDGRSASSSAATPRRNSTP